MDARCWIDAFFGRKPEPQTGLTLGLSRGTRAPVVVSDDVMRSHLAISGKVGVDISLLLERMLRQQTEQGRGWVYFDTFSDSDLLARMAQFAREQGREDEFYVIDLSEPEKSHAYAPLRSGTPDERASRAVLSLPLVVDNPGADFYRQEANYVLTVLLAAVEASGRVIGMRDLGLLPTRLGNERVLAQLLDGIPAGHPARGQLLLMLDNYRLGDGSLDEAKLKASLGGIGGRLFLLGDGPYRRVTDAVQPEVDFADILTQNKMCYVKMSPLDMEHTQPIIARLLMHDFFTAVDARARLPRRMRTPFLAVLNHFGSNGPIRATWFERARAMKVCMVPVLYGGWEAARNYSDVVDILAANTFSKVYFQQPGIASVPAADPGPEAGNLESLRIGEFVYREGAFTQRGVVPPRDVSEAHTPVDARAFRPRRMQPVPAHARFELEDNPDEVTS
ncbi:hypothetical protein AB4Y45_35425 [Paraburkholderia sp. EG287A]|uniref:hypothetical protein n=1 Tax=Paraburkholderia sp. EG287A TaxID=3237012 RepID=UPI0034D37260